MSASVRLTLVFRDGQKLDLCVEEISQLDGGLKIDANAGGDDRIIVDLAVEARSEPQRNQREVDNVVLDAAAAEGAGKDNRNVIGVRNFQVANPDLAHYLTHPNPPQQQVDLSQLYGGGSPVFVQMMPDGTLTGLAPTVESDGRPA